MSTQKRGRKLTTRQIAFAGLVAAGESQARAYRTIYNPKLANQDSAKRGSHLAAHPLVKAEVARIRSKSDVKKLLTLNDRLAILARDAQLGGETPAFINARSRCIDVYSKISGDQAPQRMELVGKDGAPIAVAATAVVARMPIRARIAALKAARAESSP